MNTPSVGFSPFENPHRHGPAGKRGGSNIGFSGTQHGRPAAPCRVAAARKSQPPQGFRRYKEPAPQCPNARCPGFEKVDPRMSSETVLRPSAALALTPPIGLVRLSLLAVAVGIVTGIG